MSADDAKPGDLADAAHWDAARIEGERVVRAALHGVAQRLLDAQAHPPLVHATAFGAAAEVGLFLHSISNPQGMHIMEQWALAYLRGGLRGTDHPIRGNGHPMEHHENG